MARELPFESSAEVDRGDSEPAFLVDVDGFEGPLDLLLELARRQKVDLQKISILSLAEQYLNFVEAARRVRLELAADYLVMAAWLAYLKSRLLIPSQTKGEEPEAADLAAALAFRLRRLEAMREAANKLVNLPRLGRDVFGRGAPEQMSVNLTNNWQATLFDLLSAYARQRQKAALSHVTLKKRAVWSLAEARETLERLAGMAIEWTTMDDYLLEYCVTAEMRRTVRASAFSASLELVREGHIEIRQDKVFAPIWVRRKPIDTTAPQAAAAE
ncbi:segregation and condensation protein A [Methylovirgula sp. 4M-Z18]|uniref:segregation and condensation protein A n=1 Tax=Methylovirgula sp. 4M-Z18 TaxID=2293567 RepID=UPI000E2FC9B2|nr:ScpA family protein [Methylovirgula sp. 4M-Z18]RFB81571.1 segregation/condensation protein A [Methylovirgula sp. 4M-Z18]